MQYRKEIDGLRAIAIIPVILFHAKFPIFTGGYLGVDIFFVISGYLITSHILEALQANNFSLLDFYERRARRILPALYFVLTCCLPFAIFWMLPSQLKQFSQGLIAVSVFFSNMFFLNESGYFESSAEENPLLHTWSLAVEEQFYIVFPLLMLMTWKKLYQKNFIIICLIAILSLCYSHWISKNSPNANFYLLITRAWELLAGSLCAYILSDRHKITSNSLYSNTCSIVGFLMLIYALIYFDKSMLLPSFYSLIPISGTALIILFAQKDSFVAKLLSLKFLVTIGLISYSAYLWHQPIFAFIRIRSIHAPSLITMGFLTVLTILLAYLTWKYVEQPFRKRSGSLKISRRLIFIYALLCAFLLVLVGFIINSRGGIVNEFKLDEIKHSYFSAINKHENQYCHLSNNKIKKNSVESCNFSDDIDILLIGDSHANTFAYSLYRYLIPKGKSFAQFTINGCPPFVGTNDAHIYCDDSVFLRRNAAIKKSEILIISARWPLYVNATFFDNKEGGEESKSNIPLRIDNNLPTSKENAQAKMNKIIQEIKSYLDNGKKIILIYPIPEAGWNVPQQIEKLKKFSTKPEYLTTSYAAFLQRNKIILEAFDALEDENLYKVKPHKLLCNTKIDNRCLNTVQEKILYIDDDHLSENGIDLLMPEIIEQINKSISIDQ